MRLEKRLLSTARDLARRTKRRPREAFMRRAVSTAYYAIFHALARACADELIGAAKANSPEWARVYRALEHGFAKTALKGADASLIDKEVAFIAAAFAELQERRHQADDDPAPFAYYSRP